MNALNLYNQGDYLSAIKMLNNEINNYGDHAEAYYLLGKIYEIADLPGGKY